MVLIEFMHHDKPIFSYFATMVKNFSQIWRFSFNNLYLFLFVQINNPDMRVEILKKYVQEKFPVCPLLDYALEVEKITTSKVGVTVTLVLKNIYMYYESMHDRVCSSVIY